jgi:hypothetical protein
MSQKTCAYGPCRPVWPIVIVRASLESTLLGLSFLRRPSFALRLGNLLPCGFGEGSLLRLFVHGPRWAAATLGFFRSGEKVPRVL